MIVATGADSPFSRSLVQLLRSLDRVGVDPATVIVHDLGLTPLERIRLERGHPDIRIREVSFHDLPPFVLPARGTFAWKPVLLAGLAEELGERFLWLDSATVALGPLTPAQEAISRTGLWVPFAGGRPVRAHPGAVDALARRGLDPRWTQLRSRAAGVCGFDPRRPEVLALLRTWRELALDLSCIAPTGCSPADHDYDQTLLNALLYDGQAQGRWLLGQDALAISSSRPVDFLMARAKVAPWVPLWLDRPLVAWRRLQRFLDVLHWRIRRLGRPPPGPDQPVR